MKTEFLKRLKLERHKPYIDFGIFNLYFIVVFCKNFRLKTN